jgi:quinolinate synthase
MNTQKKKTFLIQTENALIHEIKVRLHKGQTVKNVQYICEYISLNANRGRVSSRKVQYELDSFAQSSWHR